MTKAKLDGAQIDLWVRDLSDFDLLALLTLGVPNQAIPVQRSANDCDVHAAPPNPLQ